MRATCSTLTKAGKTKTITGTVMQRGMGRLTLIVTESDGTRKIKKIDESKFTVRIFE